MYSDANRRASMRRSNDEFLRRMVGNELMPKSQPLANPTTAPTFAPILPPELDRYPNRKPPCNESAQGEPMGGGAESCPLYVKAPSLAMVYAPRQCWQNLLEPKAALANGTLFADLALPFEAGQKNGEKEGRLSGR